MAATVLEQMTLEQLQAESDRVSTIYHEKLNSDADPRQIGLWRSRTNKVQEAITLKSEEESETKANPQAPVNVRGRQAKRKGSMYCLCGCGAANNVGARFQVGHDARLKPKLKIVEGRFKTNDFSYEGLPQIVVDALADENQVYFKKCTSCGGPFLGNQEVGPACQAVKS